VSARLFAAVDLPDAARTRLAAFGAACAAADPALRPVDGPALHVTLAFLGDRPLDDLEPAAQAVESATPAADAPLVLTLGEPLWLSPRRPHVLTVALADPGGALARLHAAVTQALAAALAWTPDRRPLRPHVTVARVRRGAVPRRRGLPPAPTGAVTAAALTLYRSHLGGGPARYEALTSVSLTPPF
jgi:2'-5' RNA ligase